MTNVEKIKFANLFLKSTILVLIDITFQNEVTRNAVRPITVMAESVYLGEFNIWQYLESDNSGLRYANEYV